MINCLCIFFCVRALLETTILVSQGLNDDDTTDAEYDSSCCCCGCGCGCGGGGGGGDQVMTQNQVNPWGVHPSLIETTISTQTAAGSHV